jgi:hypothetical protein
MSEPKFKVAREVALADFERMCVAYRVELDLSDLTDDERKEFATVRDTIVRMQMRGIVVVGADGNPTYTTPDGKSFTFHPPTGATLMAMEAAGKDKQISGTYSALADMTHTDASDFARLNLRDVHALNHLAGLFLAER